MKNNKFMPIVLTLTALAIFLLGAHPVWAFTDANDAWDGLWLLGLPDWLLLVLVALVTMLLAGLGLVLHHWRYPTRRSRGRTFATLGGSALAGLLLAAAAADTWQAYQADKILQLLPPTAAGRPVPDLLLPPASGQSEVSADGQVPLPESALPSLPDRDRPTQVNFSALKSDALYLNLFEDVDLLAVRDRLVAGPDGQAWVGHVQDDPDSEVILASQGASLAGTVTYAGRLFEIMARGDNAHAVREIDLTQLPPEDPTAVPASEDSPISDGAMPGNDAAVTGQVIDVMVVYSPQAEANAGGEAGVRSRILQAITAANQAFLNSEIDTALNLVHMGQIDYVETHSMPTTLAWLRANGDDALDEVHALRDQYGADLVVLVSADRDYCGAGYLIDGVASNLASFAFALVRDACLSTGSLAHQIGHLMGNAHNPEHAHSAGASPDAHGYRLCGEFRDLMSYPCADEPRVNLFSNPDIQYQGWPTGILGANDTARSMNDTAVTVARFQAAGGTTDPLPRIPAAPDNLQAQVTAADAITLTWTDRATDEVGYKVQSSVDGATWYEIAALGADATRFVDSGLAQGQTYAYRVLAYNGIGNADYSATVATPLAKTASSTARSNTSAAGILASAQATPSQSPTANPGAAGLKPDPNQKQDLAANNVSSSTAAQKPSAKPEKKPSLPKNTWNSWEHPHSFTQLPMTKEGWTDLLALYQHPDYYLDSRIVYVSSSLGDDATALVYGKDSPAVGPDPFKPVGPIAAYKTIQQAYAQLRHGYPDILLLRRGDVFEEALSQGWGGRWQKSGRSPMERMMVHSWGEAENRPLLRPADRILNVTGGGGTPAEIGYLIFSGFEGYAAHRDPASDRYVDANQLDANGRLLQPPAGVTWLMPGADILFEDIRLTFGQFTAQNTGAMPLQMVAVRRSIIDKNYGISGKSHAQGIYASGITGLLIEESLFDYNGKNDSIPNAYPTIFNHNLYIQVDNTDVIVKGNIISNPSSHGLQLRPGGIIEENLFLKNPIAAFISGSGGRMAANVVLSGNDISTSLPRGWGLDVLTANPTVVSHNIVANKDAGVAAGFAFKLTCAPDWDRCPVTLTEKSLTFANNIAYDWKGQAFGIEGSWPLGGSGIIERNQFRQFDATQYLVSIQNQPEPFAGFTFANNAYFNDPSAAGWFRLGSKSYGFDAWATLVNEVGSTATAPSFPDPERTIESYQQSLGLSASHDAFIAEALKQSRFNWREQFTAKAVNSYIRAGFGLTLP